MKISIQISQHPFAFLGKRMRSILVFFALIAALFPKPAYADAVSDWNATAVFIFPSLTDLAYLHIAIFDAVNAIERRYTVFAVNPPNAVPWANKEAAVHGAAYKILKTFYTNAGTYIDSVFQARIALLPNDSTTARGIEIGMLTAELFLITREGDGRLANIPYIWQPAGPGVYQTTPPGSAPYQPLNPWLAVFRPFSFDFASQFRAPGPPPLNSNTYARDFNEVKKYGSLDTSCTTPEEREIARFHTENPNIQISRNIRLFAESQGLPLSDNARFFAQIYVSISDALTAGWDSKYYYNYWRPSTAIHNANIDGNPSTIQDTTWTALVATPRHPEYPAAHGCGSGAFAKTLKLFFGTNDLPVTLTSTVTGVQHHFTSINDIYDEIIIARVYGGMHFRTSVEDGLEIGKKVAEWVSENKFQIFVPVDELIYVLPLNTGIKNGMAAKLRKAAKAYSNGKYNVTENLLNELMSKVEYFISQGTITLIQAQPLIDYINNYLDLINAQLPKMSDNEIPEEFSLLQNYPNPFNPVTTIEFQIPNTSNINLKVYDILGNEVLTLVNEERPAGIYQVSFDAKDLSSGVYLYKLQTGSFIQTKKMLLMK